MFERSEFEKRRGGSGLDDSSFPTRTNEFTEEDKEIAKTSPIIDPFNKKINNLGPKSRDNWLKKIQQIFNENASATNTNNAGNICVLIEHEIFISAKNLIIYQANCMKKISELKKYTKEGRSYLTEYEATRLKKEAEAEQEHEKKKAEICSIEVKKEVESLTCFTSALKMLKSEDMMVIRDFFFQSNFIYILIIQIRMINR